MNDVIDKRKRLRGSAVLRRLAAVALLISSIGALAITIAASSDAVHKDAVEYWAAARLLLERSNPYDPAAVLRVERSVGYTAKEPLVMFNPPYVLTFALPLGFLSIYPALLVWTVLIVLALIVSIRILWVMHERPDGRLHLLGYVFAPTVACMQLGQMAMFALLGIVLFLYLYDRRPFAAGLCIPLLAIKPHLLVAFGLVLAYWAITQRAYRFMAGALAGFTLALGIPLCLDPRLFWEYLPVLKTANTYSGAIPTLSAFLRSLHSQSAWVQYAPAVLAGAWALWRFGRRRHIWRWDRDGLPLLLVSLWTAPYSWFEDDIIVLPAILNGIYVSEKLDRPLIAFAAPNAIALGLALWSVPFMSGTYVWTSSAWLGWYLWATRQPQTSPLEQETAKSGL